MAREFSKFEVLMDDGKTLTCEVDQRDYAAWEAAPENDGSGRGRHTGARYFAWSALRRAGEYKSGFRRFNEIDCVQVELIETNIPTEPDTDEGEEETEQDNPTRD